MPYATDADLLLRVPAAASATSDQRAVALLDSREYIDDEAFGGKTVRAHCMLAAHFLAASTLIPGDEAGVVSSRSAGEISVGYAVTAPASSEDFSSTGWGRKFLQIRATVGHAGLVG
jgi:hypothetical protein